MATTTSLGLTRPDISEQGWGPEIQATIDLLDALLVALNKKKPPARIYARINFR